jgi:hypothetical protein
LGNPGLVPAFGLAAGFNNTNSSVAVTALGTNNQFTLEVWANPRSFGATSPGNPPHTGYNSIYTTDNWVPRALHTHFINFNGPSFIQWELAINGNSPTAVAVGTPGLFRTNAWVHLAATYDSIGRRLIAYVNGSAITTNS